MTFSATTASAAKIKEDQQYEGVRIKFLAHLENVRIPIQVDVGFGDAVNPSLLAYPTLLPMSAPLIQAYPMNSVIAEKLEAIVSLGMLNRRMKDFFDIWFLARTFPFGAAALGDAIRATSTLTVWTSCLLTSRTILLSKRSGGRSCKEPASKCRTPSPTWSSRFASFSRLPCGPSRSKRKRPFRGRPVDP